MEVLEVAIWAISMGFCHDPYRKHQGLPQIKGEGEPKGQRMLWGDAEFLDQAAESFLTCSIKRESLCLGSRKIPPLVEALPAASLTSFRRDQTLAEPFLFSSCLRCTESRGGKSRVAAAQAQFPVRIESRLCL